MKLSLTDWLRALPRGMAVTVAVCFVLLNGLGVWQLYRLQWKEGLIADMARSEAMPPVPVSSLLAERKPDWRSARLPMCHFDPQHLLYMHSELSGTPGYRVLASCPLQEGAVLVDLGFVTGKLGTLDFFGFEPVGRLRPFEKSNAFTPVNRPKDGDWYWRSAPEMGCALGFPLRSDYFLVLDLAASNVHIPGLVQGPLTAPLRNRHFEYALTWFGLAWTLVGVFVGVVYQRAQQNKAAAAL
jgi:surfeit locus 1 family protein